MKKNLLLGACTLVLFATLPVFAYSEMKNAPDNPPGAAVENNSESRNAASEKAIFIGGEPSISGTTINVDLRMTARGMIGSQVYDENHKKISEVKDIILDQNGKALLIVLENGGFMGINEKLAALDYDSIISRATDGDMLMPLTKDRIARAAAFSYDARPKGATLGMPGNSLAMTRLLSGKLLDDTGKTVAAVDNITFRDSSADKLIASYGKILGLGSDKVALDYNALRIVQKGLRMDVQMDKNISAEFEKYKNNRKTASN